LTQPERAVEHHTALVVGTHENIERTMKAIRDAVPYINAQAGLSRSGQALVDYYEHCVVDELQPGKGASGAAQSTDVGVRPLGSARRSLLV